MMYNLVVMENFGVWLRQTRKDCRLTQKQLSEISGVSESYISTLERNQPHSVTGAILRPEPDKVEKLAKALKADIDEARVIAGYAPISNIQLIRNRINVSDFDEFDDKDLDDIAEYIALKKLKKQL